VRPPPRGSTRRRRRAFTLLETAFAIMLVGLGVVSMLELLAAGTAANLQGAQTTVGVNFAKNIREAALRMSFDELVALDGQMITPPVDSSGEVLGEFAEWTQAVRVDWVNPNQLTADLFNPSHAVRVTVTVWRNDSRAADLSWHVLNSP
jgi:type II secretory pathway pseudopilin PulG